MSIRDDLHWISPVILLSLGRAAGSDSEWQKRYLSGARYDLFHSGEGFMDKHCNGCHSSYLPEECEVVHPLVDWIAIQCL